MPKRERRLPVALGQPRKLPQAAGKGPSPGAIAEVTVVIRPRKSDREWRALVTELTSGLPRDRRYLTRAQLSQEWAASPDDLETVRRFATEQGLKVVSADAFRRCVVVSGPLKQLAKAFAVKFFAVAHPLGIFRSHLEAPSVPESVHPIVECILGLDDLPVAQVHATQAAAADRWMDRQALLDAYAIPTNLRGDGQCVAIIELGGGFYRSDLVNYFKKFGFAPPRVRTRSIGGVKNTPAPRKLIRKITKGQGAGVAPKDFGLFMWTFETTMDIAAVGTIAPEVSILLVQSPNDSQGQYHAVSSTVADTRNAPSVLSCSWGSSETGQPVSLMRALDRWFQAAAVIGMTVCCSSGDSGDSPVPKHPNRLTAHFPASSPYVLACGGTTLDESAGTEVAWIQPKGNNTMMASGGGFSKVFSLPAWQCSAGVDPEDWIPSDKQSGKGRAVPDVAAKANMETDCCVLLGGVEVMAGGTSFAAPLWAGVAAILNEGLDARVGSLHRLLYNGTLSSGLRDIVDGDTGLFHACKGWDACTGWGSPKAKELLRVLRG